MYVRGYLQGSKNGRVVTIDPSWDRRGCERMVVRFITTYAISAYYQ